MWTGELVKKAIGDDKKKNEQYGKNNVMCLTFKIILCLYHCFYKLGPKLPWHLLVDCI